MKYPKNPEMIATIEALKPESGDETTYGDRIASVAVFQDTGSCRDGEVQLEVRDLDDETGNLMIRLPLPELMAALASAILNAERDTK